jgi:methyl-accepting chemotaxis protein
MKQKKGSIKKKIIIATFCITLVVFLAMGLIINTQVKNQLENEVQVKLLKDAEIISKELDVFFQRNAMLVEQMTKNPDIIDIVKTYDNKSQKRNHKNYDKIVEILQNIKATDTNIGLVWLGVKDANDLITDMWDYDSADDYDLVAKGWYQEMLANQGLTYTDPYVDAVTGNTVISIVAPVYDGSEVVGNVGIDVELTEVSDFMSTYNIGKTGYPVLISATGVVVHHKDESQIMEVNMIDSAGKLGEIAGEMISGKAGIDSYKHENIDKYIAYAPIKANNWSVATMVPKSETTEIVNRFIFTNTAMFIGVTILLLAAIFILISKSLKNVPKLVQSMNIFSNGDLTHRLDIKTNDEIGQIGVAYNEAAKNLRKVISDAFNSSDNVKESSKVMVTISNESKQALKEVSVAITEVAEGTSDQASQTEKSVKSIHELSQEIEGIVDKTGQIYERVENVHKLSVEGSSILKDLNNQSIENQKSVKTIKDIVKEMDSSSNEISTIVEMINSISEQTNLLALNASIEAARAGEAGKGFAVVAEEIRKLAEQTNGATDEIREKIIDIQQKSTSAVKQTEDSENIVLKNVEIVENTENIFSNILNDLTQLFEISQGSKVAAEQMRNKKEEIIEFIETVSASSEETSAAMEEMSASTEEQLAVMENLSEESEKMNELSEYLHEILEKFKV